MEGLSSRPCLTAPGLPLSCRPHGPMRAAGDIDTGTPHAHPSEETKQGERPLLKTLPDWTRPPSLLQATWSKEGSRGHWRTTLPAL